MRKLLSLTYFAIAVWSGSLLALLPAAAQIPEAREAIAEESYQEAIEILTRALSENPTADTYLYLGLAHSNLSQYERALELFDEGAARYPNDPRFHSESAGVHIANRDVEAAVESLKRALAVDPDDTYSSDLLASVRLSEGRVHEALDTWNQVGRPQIDNIFENFSPGFLNAAVPPALAFAPGDVLNYNSWKTTSERLFASELFANVGLDIEPSGPGDRYNAIVRTSNKSNDPGPFFARMIREIPFETVHLDVWNIGFSGISWQSNFRWDEDRRRLQGQLTAPLPLPSLPILEVRDTWRSEQWNLSRSLRPDFQTDAAFEYKVNAVTAYLTVTPTDYLQMILGFDYRNRDVIGNIARLAMDERNSGAFDLNVLIRPVDGARYKNQLRIRAGLARKSVAGDLDFSRVSASALNRILLDDNGRALFDWSLSGGTSRGELPIDQYFILGLSDMTEHRLRGHVASDHGRYGKAPMGTDFVLVNTDIQYRLLTIPLFNTLDIPFIQVRAMGFFDSAKVFDRQRIFEQGEWFNDVGAGLRFEVPTTSFTVVYGRDTHQGENSFYGYVEQRLW